MSFNMASRESVGKDTAWIAAKLHPTGPSFLSLLAFVSVLWIPSSPPSTLPLSSVNLPLQKAFLKYCLFPAPTLTSHDSQGSYPYFGSHPFLSIVEVL